MDERQEKGSEIGRTPGQRLHARAAILSVAALALTLSACASNGASSAPAATATVEPASAGPLVGGGEGSNVTVWTLSSATKAGVGAYLVAESTTGQDALTVYVLDKDVPGSGTSACDATCSKTWPPLLLTDSDTARVSGITGKLAQVTWSDGTVQVAYNGEPLYFSADDHGAGDTNGVGVSPSWSVATP